MEHFYYPSQGRGQLHGCRWLPDGEVRGIVQIVHGIAEYVERYDDQLLMICCIDNLLKGAVGQAVQNMNLMFGLNVKSGLNLKASAF